MFINPTVDMSICSYTILEIYIFKTTVQSFHSLALTILDVRDLQTFLIIWSQVISANQKKGIMEFSATNEPPKFN